MTTTAQFDGERAIACMNRGHALALAGEDRALRAAIEAYGQAIVLMRNIPPAELASWANSLGAALMNRGQLLHRAFGAAKSDTAFAHFADAETVLGPLVATSRHASSPWPGRNLAGTILNRATLMLDLDRPADARSEVMRALGFVAPGEKQDPIDADLALKLRRTLCEALGRLIVAPGVDQEALATEASEIVDEALALVRWWADRGVHFRLLGARFFRYGARLYASHQPQFLGEFLIEHVTSAAAADDPELIAIAREAVDAALGAPPVTPYLVAGDPATRRRLEIETSLHDARERLQGMTASRITPAAPAARA